jgi:hypothetical protein
MPDNGRVGRLPDPRLLQDRVRNQESNKRLKKLVHVTNGRWMTPLGFMLMFFLLVSLPVALLDRAYYWVWGLSLLVPITMFCCALNPDRPRKITMTTIELKEHLTPRSLPDDRRRKTPWERIRTSVRMLTRRFRKFSPARSRRGPSPARTARPTTGRPDTVQSLQPATPDEEPLEREADAPIPDAPTAAANPVRPDGTRWSRMRSRLRPRWRRRAAPTVEAERTEPTID